MSKYKKNIVEEKFQFVKAVYSHLVVEKTGVIQSGENAGKEWKLNKLSATIPANAHHPLKGMKIVLDQSIIKSDGTRSKLADLTFTKGDTINVVVERFKDSTHYNFKLVNSSTDSAKVEDLDDLFANFVDVNETTAAISQTEVVAQ